jgi:NAD kinase
MDSDKIILVTRKTRLEGLIERFNTREQARFYLQHSGDDFGRYEEEHETYLAALRTLKERLDRLGKLQVIERGFLPNFIFGKSDLVVAVGIDGLVVNTAKYLDGQLLVAVNPDPAHIDGLLLPFRVEQAEGIVRRALQRQVKTRAIRMAQASLADGQRLVGFNDLFIGARSHVSARYTLRQGQRSERHSSSGIIVSTGVGSTGWLSSLFNMTNGILAAFSGPGQAVSPPILEWESDRLVYVVREPFASKTSAAAMVGGWVDSDMPLLVQSEMPSGGVIFSDGVEADFLAFNAGASATIGLAEKKTLLVVE